jgi:hypothetical protein
LCCQQGPEYNDDEVACQSDLGSAITTGGGFSHYHALPSWQADQVEGYLRRVRGTNKQPASGYDPTKRGYPDVALMANNYGVFTGGAFYRGEYTRAPIMIHLHWDEFYHGWLPFTQYRARLPRPP